MFPGEAGFMKITMIIVGDSIRPFSIFIDIEHMPNADYCNLAFGSSSLLLFSVKRSDSLSLLLPPLQPIRIDRIADSVKNSRSEDGRF